MPRLLIISALYPPHESIGSRRISAHVDYLQSLGWDCIILTASPLKDHPKSKLNIKQNVHIIPWLDIFYYIKSLRTTKKNHNSNEVLNPSKILEVFKYFIPSSLVRMPDRLVFWVFPAIKAGMSIISSNKIDLIYSSSGPIGSSIVASFLSKYYKIPWIPEFRDIWSHNIYDNRPQWYSNLEMILEKLCLKYSKAIITVSNPLKSILERRHKKPTYVIYNGFDLIKTSEIVHKKYLINDFFNIVYTGTIYPGKRDPNILFTALSNLVNKNTTNINKVKVHFWGRDIERYLLPGIKDLNLENQVIVHGLIDHDKIIKIQKESNLLLFLEYNDFSAAGTITGKIFEYIRSERPILAICYPGVIKDLLDKTKTGVVLNKTEDIELFITNALINYETDIDLGFDFDKNEINKLSRRRQVNFLSKIFFKFI